MNEEPTNPELSPEERTQLLLRERVELEIQKRKLEEKTQKIAEELQTFYHMSDADLQEDTFVNYEGQWFLLQFNCEDGELYNVVPTVATTFIQL